MCDDSKLSFSVDSSFSEAETNKTKSVPTKLYVSNFPSNCTRRHLTEFFSKFGQVLECAIMWDTYAFIHYSSMADAQNAVRQANGAYLMGNRLSIQLSTSRNRQKYDWYQQEAVRMYRESSSKENSL